MKDPTDTERLNFLIATGRPLHLKIPIHVGVAEALRIAREVIDEAMEETRNENEKGVLK